MPGIPQIVAETGPWVAVLLGSGGIGYLLKVVLGHRRSVRKQTDDMASNVVGVYAGRLAFVERHAVICDAELAHSRHKVNNLGGTFDSMLMMLEVSPEKMPEIIARTKEKRARDIEMEAAERAHILAAALKAAGLDPEEESERMAA